MMNDLPFQMQQKTDEELDNYIKHIRVYEVNTIRAAVTELENRGRYFSAEELDFIDKEIQIRRGISENREITFDSRFEKETCADEKLPLLYSKLAITLFTIFGDTLFGSILMSMNLRQKGLVTESHRVTTFGIIYALIDYTIYICYSSDFVGIIFNLVGVLILRSFFWNEYIGYETVYKKRSVTAPLIIFIFVYTIITGIFYAAGVIN